MQAINRLLSIMTQLRDPDNGCPWDKLQTFKTIVPHTLEEAYEVADAIEREDPVALRDELGDLLFQVVFYAQLAKEQQLFDFNDVVTSISDKRRTTSPACVCRCRDHRCPGAIRPLGTTQGARAPGQDSTRTNECVGRYCADLAGAEFGAEDPKTCGPSGI